MRSNTNTYLDEVGHRLASGEATEHTYRPALQRLIEALGEHVTATNEPRRVACGAPDFRVSRDLGHGAATIGYIEAKDIGADLAVEERGEQLKRYRNALGNLILTDYIEFRWYVDGQFQRRARLASIDGGRLVPDPAGLKEVLWILDAFLARRPEPISDPPELARRMARLTHLIRDLIIADLESEHASDTLRDLRAAFSEVLMPDLSVANFADMYAQTLAYGLFAARMNHHGRGPFRRDHAAAEIPHANPFLRRLFAGVAGPDLDDEVYVGFVDDIADLLSTADVETAMVAFGEGGRRDPVFHFYETFLAAYDPQLREQRGVYYTPEPVVSYIVRSVDYVLKEQFGLADGLADDSTVEVEYTDDHGKTIREEVPRVLILDPACGTGTFLYAVVDLIRRRFMDRGDAGKWREYVRTRLLPRLFGFELLMAPYAVAHLKLGMQLAALDLPEEQRRDWAYEFAEGERLGVYLTNTLEEGARRSELLFGRYISEEANAAARVKRDLPIMVIIGNPPYSGHSANKGPWIEGLLKGHLSDGTPAPSYYDVAGRPLAERQSKWLHDDYVKFVRFGQWRIERTESGVLAFVTNHGYLRNPTFRGMREKLSAAFTDLRVLDLHGSTRKREGGAGDEVDENVFDIQQGVAIAVLVKRPGTPGPGAVHYAELWGSRERKYGVLSSTAVNTTAFHRVEPEPPHFSFVPQDMLLAGEYADCFRLEDALPAHGVGMVTARDSLALAMTAGDLLRTLERFAHMPAEEARKAFALGADARDWRVEWAQDDIVSSGFADAAVKRVLYRPFDWRFTYYTGRTRGFICMPCRETMRHLLQGPNLGLITTRTVEIGRGYEHALCSRCLVQHHTVSSKEVNYLFPLYAYDATDEGQTGQRGLFGSQQHAARRANLTPEFTALVAQRTGLSFIEDGVGDLEATFGPEDVFHFIYAVLYSPTYRSRYAEFLKREFPRIPVTSDLDLFRALCGLGAELVSLHLMESPALRQPVIHYPVPGDNVVERGHPKYLAPGEPDPTTGEPLPAGRVYISRDEARGGRRGQYFEGVPPEVWEYQVGGYQVCEKWLKDRRGRALSLEDMEHYNGIVVALAETIRLQGEIDEAIVAHGGFPLQ
jgi:hypothetical protein